MDSESLIVLLLSDSTSVGDRDAVSLFAGCDSEIAISGLIMDFFRRLQAWIARGVHVSKWLSDSFNTEITVHNARAFSRRPRLRKAFFSCKATGGCHDAPGRTQRMYQNCPDIPVTGHEAGEGTHSPFYIRMIYGCD